MKNARLLFCLVVLAAAAGADVMPLSLSAAVERALEVDEGYKTAEADVEGMKAGIDLARSTFIPKLTLDASATKLYGVTGIVIPADSFGAGFPPADVDMGGQPDKMLSAGLTLTQPLYQGGREYIGLRLSKTAVYLSQEKVRQERADVVYNVASAYYGAVLAEEAVRVADTAVAVATSHVGATEDRYDAGLVSEYDVLRARVQLTNLQTLQRQAEDRRALARRYLLTLLNMPADAEVALTDRLEFELESFDLEESLASGQEKRPELAQLEHTRKLAEANVKANAAADNPFLYFIANYTDSAGDYTLDVADEWSDSGSLVLSLSWPIFDGLATRSRVRGARADLYKVERNQERVVEAVDLEIRTAYDNLLTIVAEVRSSQENVKLAEKGLSIAEARYDAGLMSNLEVLDAQSALTQARLGYYSALQAYALAKLAMYKARGEIEDYMF